LGIERCGKINASNSGAESWTGIGVVAGFSAVVFIMEGPHVRNGEGHWGAIFLQILQEVRIIYKTRNQLMGSDQTQDVAVEVIQAGLNLPWQ